MLVTRRRERERERGKKKGDRGIVLGEKAGWSGGRLGQTGTDLYCANTGGAGRSAWCDLGQPGSLLAIFEKTKLPWLHIILVLVHLDMSGSVQFVNHDPHIYFYAMIYCISSLLLSFSKSFILPLFGVILTVPLFIQIYLHNCA